MTESRQLTWIALVEDMLRDAQLDHGGDIRFATDRDVSGLAELYLAAYPRSVVSDLDEARDELGQTFAGQYGTLNLAASPVAESGDGIVGAVLTVHEAPWYDTPPGPFIIEVMVHPDHRRRRLGLRCMLAAAGALSSAGERTAALRVMSDNEAAMALYRGLGFVPWTWRGKDPGEA
jgi:ribosomal protein S18 acetylase RimI-like enzyme